MHLVHMVPPEEYLVDDGGNIGDLMNIVLSK